MTMQELLTEQLETAYARNLELAGMVDDLEDQVSKQAEEYQELKDQFLRLYKAYKNLQQVPNRASIN